ncbi:MAG: hypothetical protein LBK40_05115 [Spirochaetaceae bacterium]|jgi:hypothetical protein|nr:hypothetical protein [Spirochaetaceae bacterium]
MDVKKAFERFGDQGVFVKTGRKTDLDGPQKAALNRKGNMLFNSGNIEGARRVFLTTGYTDGLVRVGDYYLSRGRNLDALRMYWLAPDHKKSEPIIAQLSFIIQKLLKEEGSSNE